MIVVLREKLVRLSNIMGNGVAIELPDNATVVGTVIHGGTLYVTLFYTVPLSDEGEA